MKEHFYFASANTSYGFLNNFNYINNENSSHFTYIIKGSSGCGKSTLMKRIANYFKLKKYSIEYFYCSSDPASLDAIRIVEKNISIVDGTNPHAIESKMPGIYDKVINFGDLIDYKIITSKNKIDLISQQKKDNYEIIYNYLKSIGNIEKINNSFYKTYTNRTLENTILSSASKNYTNKTYLRKLFLQALDINGINDFTVKNNFNVVTFDINKYQFSNICKNVINNLLDNGIYVTAFYDILYPENIISILINNKILFTYNQSISNENIEENSKIINQLITLASNKLNKTRTLHFELEKIYSNYISFNKIDKIYKSVVSDIEKSI